MIAETDPQQRITQLETENTQLRGHIDQLLKAHEDDRAAIQAISATARLALERDS